MKRLLLAFLLLGVSLFVGCGGSSGGSTPPPVVTLQSIAITPSGPSITAGSTQQFKATGSYSDGSTKDLTSAANWLSATQSVATINVSGLATAVAAGTSSISASSAGITGTTTLTVTAVPLVSIAVTPPTASVAPNGQQAFTAIGTYADQSTKNITTSVTWSASVGASINPAGLAIGITPNTTSTIMATLGSISGTATLTITNPLVSIAVTPPTASIAVPFTQSFTATGTYADNSTSVITSTVTWASSAPLIATISNSLGTQGLATAIAPGTTAITATLGSVTSPSATLTVTNATLVSIAVTPAVASIPLGNQQQFMATGTFSDSSKQDITSTVTWTSSDTTKVTIVGSGLATGVAVTSSAVTITATKGAVSGTATLSVTTPTLVSITVTPSTTTLAQGTSIQYTATGKRTNGSTLNITNLATWTSLDPTVAGVTNGLVKAAASVPNTHNAATIQVTYSGITQTVLLDVTNATVTTLTVTPITATIPVGVTQQFTATATFTDTSSQDVSSNATWTPSDPTVATVTFFGRATSLKVGTITITAAFGGHSGTTQLTVSPATLLTIAITPASTVLAPGSSVTYQAVGTYSDASKQYLANATWTSSDTTKVTINAAGVATAQSAGSANITANYQGVISNIGAVVVEQSPLVSIAVSPSTATVPEGVSIPFTATGTFQDTSTQNLTTNVTWAAGQASVASISNALGSQGFATGVAPGQTSITAVFAGVVGNATLNVTNATIVSIAVTPNPASAPAGTPVNYTAKGTFSDQSIVDLSTQATWSSSNTTVATINNVGQANTASAGTSTISATFGGVTGLSILTVH